MSYQYDEQPVLPSFTPKPATDRQKLFLSQRGKWRNGMSAAEARDLIKQIKQAEAQETLPPPPIVRPCTLPTQSDPPRQQHPPQPTKALTPEQKDRLFDLCRQTLSQDRRELIAFFAFLHQEAGDKR